MEIKAEYLNLFLNNCKTANCAGVFYSLPFQNEFELLIQDFNVRMKDLSDPFIFFPFDETETAPIFLYPTHHNENAIELLSRSGGNREYWINSSLLFVESTSKEKYQENFEIFQKKIQSKKCKKAILSTVIKKNIPQDFDTGEYVLKLRDAYPQAFIYLFTSPISGTWIGATPETLVKWESGKVSTMSLAGTKKINSTDEFGAKEKEEQKIVTEYIESIFKSMFPQVNLDSTTKLVYGEIEHLITKVEAVSGPLFSKQHFLELAAELHPTPAVGGYPKKEALDLINETEIHPRLYYSGYLGSLGEASGHLAVNLRCMCLGRDHLHAYAGGGITADSNMDSEWEETRLKGQALLKFL